MGIKTWEIRARSGTACNAMRWLILTCLILGAILATKSEINEEEQTLAINGLECKEQNIENKIEEGGLKVENIAAIKNDGKKKEGKKKNGNKKVKKPNSTRNKPEKHKKQQSKKTKRLKRKRPKHRKKKDKKVRKKKGKGKGKERRKEKGVQKKKKKKKKHKNDKKKKRKLIKNLKKKKGKKKEFKNLNSPGGKQATEMSCDEIILSRIKLERKAVNYMRQFNRSKRFMGK